MGIFNRNQVVTLKILGLSFLFLMILGEVFSGEWQKYQNEAKEYTKGARNFDIAVIVAQKAVTVAKDEYGIHSTERGESLLTLGEIYQREHQFFEASLYFNQALSVFEKKFGHDHIKTFPALEWLADISMRQKHFDKAVGLLKRAIDTWEKEYGQDLFHTRMHLNLAGSHIALKQHEQAENIFKKWLKNKEKKFGADHISIAGIATRMAQFYLLQKRYADSEQYYKRALVIQEKNFGKSHRSVISTLEQLLNIYELSKKEDDRLLVQKRLSALLK